MKAEREHLKSIRQSLSPTELASLEDWVIARADHDVKVALANPQFREFQLRLLVDQRLLDIYPAPRELIKHARQ